MTTLIVPLDETDVSERALPVAGALARATGADVLLVSVDSARVEPGRDLFYLDRELGRLPHGVLGRRVLDRVDEDVDAAIVDIATTEPDAVIVMGTHARSGPGSLLLGSVADGVIRRSPVPVVLVGPRCAADDHLTGPVVVALDGGALDADLVAAGASVSRALGESLVLAHARVPVAVDSMLLTMGERSPADDAIELARPLGVDVTSRTVESATTIEGVLDVVDETDASLVVVGTRRPGRVGRALLGSTADGIARRVRCPVVVLGGRLADGTPTPPATRRSRTPHRGARRGPTAS